VLAAHADVMSAVVIVREDVPGDKRLTGYYVPAPGRSLDVSTLRRWCRQTLPEYMVPGALVALAALPLSPNGKVDRRSLPAPQGARHALGDDHAAPRTDLEQKVCAIWMEVLGLDEAGIQDNFFDLGGHSLLAMRVVNRIEALTGVEAVAKHVLKVSATLQHPQGHSRS